MSDNPYASPRASGTPAQRRAGPRLIAAVRTCFYVLGAMGLILDGMAWYTFLTRRIDVLWWLGTLGVFLSGAGEDWNRIRVLDLANLARTKRGM